jgi:hypothetical protein
VYKAVYSTRGMFGSILGVLGMALEVSIILNKSDSPSSIGFYFSRQFYPFDVVGHQF